jgi:pimeloyl-ACP methyl ester carboxylesterase
VLDSVYPPQVDFYAGLVLHQQDALERGLGACAADAACAAAYPDIVERMYSLVARATAAPLTVEYTDATGGAATTMVDGRRLLGVFIRAVTDTSYLGSLPKLIAEIEGGEYGQLQSIVAVQEAAGSSGSVALRQTVLGSEELPFADATAISEESAQLRQEVADTGINVLDAEELATERAFNDAWGVATRPVLETEPVSSDVPMLILAGELDPTTPRAWADLAAETLSRSTVLEFRGLGHSVLFQRQTDCVMEIVAAFVDAPTEEVDASCAEELAGPVWILSVGQGGSDAVELLRAGRKARALVSSGLHFPT